MTTTSHPRPDHDTPRVPRDEPGHDAGRDAGRASVEPAPEKEREAPARLSLTQVVASALAAVSTTVLLSYFGTAGTIIGAGIASALTVVANYVYTRSIQKTREQLVPVVGKVVQVTTGTTSPRGSTTTAVTATVTSVQRGSVPVEGDAATSVLPTGVGEVPANGTGGDVPTDGVVGDAATDPADGGETSAPTTGTTTSQNPWLRLVDRYGRGRVLTVTALALFVVVMGVVLVVELAIGKPISDAVRGVEGSGTTIGRERSTGTDDPATPAPSTPSEDPSSVPTQDPTPTPTPSTTPTDEPSTTPTPEPTPGPTQDPTPDPTTTPDPEPTEETTPGTGSGGEGSGTGTGAGTGTPGGGSAEPEPTPSTSVPASA